MKYLVALACLLGIGLLATPAQAGVGVNVGVGVPLGRRPLFTRRRPRITRLRRSIRPPCMHRPRSMHRPRCMWDRERTSIRESVSTAAGAGATEEAVGIGKPIAFLKSNPEQGHRCSGFFWSRNKMRLSAARASSLISSISSRPVAPFNPTWITISRASSGT